MADPLTGTFTATGQSAPVPILNKANVLITGGVGTVQVEKSFDGGTTWYPVSKNSDGTNAAYTTASDTAFNGTVEEPEHGVQYRLNCTAYTSGTITYRISR